jgi:hypothetical protein
LLQEKHFVKGLARALQIQLLATDATLLEQYRLASTQARQKALETLFPFAQSLWRQIQTEEAVRNFVQQALAHDEKPYSYLARLLLPSVRAELGEAFLQTIRQNADLELSLQPITYACARYLANVVRVWPVEGLYFRLPQDTWIKANKDVEVAWQYPESSTQSITAAQYELRAKTLMLLIALAIPQAKARPGQAIFVGLADMMSYFGYKLGEKANARYYWLHAAEVVRAMLHDLPGHRVRINHEVALPLLPVPQVVFRNPRGWNLEALLHSRDPSRSVREAQILGFFVRFEPTVLALLGPNTSQPTRRVPAAFFSLRGPCFWLAWRVVYWQQWNCSEPYNLFQLLDESGYLEAHIHQGRIRYKDALKAWWADVGQLVEIGLLDEPGVRIWKGKHDISDRLSRQMEARERIGPHQLSGLNVVFTI